MAPYIHDVRERFGCVSFNKKKRDKCEKSNQVLFFFIFKHNEK